MVRRRNFIITRHSGAVEWMREEYPSLFHRHTEICSHLSKSHLEDLSSQDRVIGIIPIHLGEKICSKGADLVLIQVHVPPELRGEELTAQDMRRLGASLRRYVVTGTPVSGGV